MLDGMTFVITGAAQGIGSGTARVAARKGANVVIADIDDALGESLAQEIEATGARARYFHCDVEDAAQIAGLMEYAAREFGGIDVLHNNAGVQDSQVTREFSIDTLSEEVWDKIQHINVRAMWLCSKYALPYLKRSPYASIINSGSISSYIGFPGNLAYGASKAAVAGLTRNLAVDLARYRIRVNCYCPASIRTRQVTDYAAASPDPEATLKQLANWHLVPRLGEPEDVGQLVCFLASREASFITGAVWLIDAGALSWRGTNDSLGLPFDDDI